jgi:hypothetical protein
MSTDYFLILRDKNRYLGSVCVGDNKNIHADLIMPAIQMAISECADIELSCNMPDEEIDIAMNKEKTDLDKWFESNDPRKRPKII